MTNGSLSMQFQQKIGNGIGTRLKSAILDKMDTAARVMIHEVANTRDFHDVTGNLLNSIAVGIYYKGKLVNIIDAETIGRKSPTRSTLAKGERYDLDTYYSGKPARRKLPSGKKARPYKGEVGPGGQDGVSVARRSLRQRHPNKTYALVVVAPLPYAKFVQEKRGHDVLTGLRDEIPYAFEGSIVSI